MSELSLAWLGCAGFRLEYEGVGLLIDPWISRHPWAVPPVVATEDELWPASSVVLSHGHFDHAADLPHLTKGRKLPVYAARGTAKLLERHGVAESNLVPVDPTFHRAEVGPFTVRAQPTKHIFYGCSLILRTLARIGWRAPSLIPLALNWPCGQALAWRITVGGIALVHMGTAGATARELDRIAADGPVDVLLVALQGHARIHQIAAKIVQRLMPSVVIPHHQDDFYPPISATVPVEPFENLVAGISPMIRVIEVSSSRSFHLPRKFLNNRASGALIRAKENDRVR